MVISRLMVCTVWFIDRAAAVQRPGAAPVAGVVVGLAAPPGVRGDRRGDRAQSGPFVTRLEHLLGGPVEPVLRDHRDDLLPERCSAAMIRSAAASGDVDRLLDDDVFAGVECGDRHVGVQAAGRADGHGVDVVAGQQGRDVVGGSATPYWAASASALSGSRSAMATNAAVSDRAVRAWAWTVADHARRRSRRSGAAGARCRSCVGDSFAVEDGGESLGGADEVVGAGESAERIRAAEVGFHGEEAVVAVGQQRPDGLPDLPSPSPAGTTSRWPAGRP